MAMMAEQLSTSSIGVAWPPELSSYERIRGFYDGGVVQTASDCDEILKIWDECIDNLQNDGVASRLSLRFVAEIPLMSLLERMGVTIEAAIPLAQTDGLALVYSGHNMASRRLNDDYLSAHYELLGAALDRPEPRISGYDLLKTNGYGTGLIDRRSPAAVREDLLPEFSNLYAIFGYGKTDVEDIVNNERNTIAYVTDMGRVVSTAMAEHASVPVRGFGDLNLYEITEASTLPSHRSRGLYRAVSGWLTRTLISGEATDNDRPHAIYGESNLAMRGVIYAAEENGRRFCFFDRENFGVTNPAFGILPQNFSVQDQAESRMYNDFAVSYVPPMMLEGGR